MVDSTAQSAPESAPQNAPDGERPSAGTASPATPSAGSPRGRRAGVIVYWLLIVFIIGFGVRSVTEQVFWPQTNAATPGRTCSDGLGTLTTELRERGAARAAGILQVERASPEDITKDDDAFFESWDARYRALDHLCTGDVARGAFGALARYRYSLEQSLVRNRRGETALLQDLDARLIAVQSLNSR